MDKVTYIKRAKGGYHAVTDKGTIIVERLYTFTLPTTGWASSYRGKFFTIGLTRKEAVELVYNKITN